MLEMLSGHEVLVKCSHCNKEIMDTLAKDEFGQQRANPYLGIYSCEHCCKPTERPRDACQLSLTPSTLFVWSGEDDSDGDPENARHCW